jgi:hypothetical protein
MWKIVLLVGQLSTGSTSWFTSNMTWPTEAACTQALPAAILEAQARMEAVPDAGAILADGICVIQGKPA